MQTNITFPNAHFGKHAWLYWPSFFLILGPILAFIFFITFIFRPGYESLTKTVMLLSALFFLGVITKGVTVLGLSFKTAKKILVTDEDIELLTYPGSTVKLKSVSVVEDVTSRFRKKHYRLLFPMGCCVYRVVSDNKEYYLPIAEEHLSYLDVLRQINKSSFMDQV